MTLPFKKKSEARVWSCFVCGLEYSDYDSFKNHVVESHESGREYITCPLIRCQAVVRDLPTHFKVHHPTEKCPNKGPMRSIIWKDFGPKGKSKTRKLTCRKGTMWSNKNQQEMKYRSGLECETYELLEAIPTILGYAVEPFSIPYLYEGEQHQYFPDILARFADGSTELMEVKPAAQTDVTQFPQNKAKWIAAEAFCQARGWSFQVLTEVGIGKLRALAQRAKALNETAGN